MKMKIVSVDVVSRPDGPVGKIHLEDPKDPEGSRVSFNGGELGAVVEGQIVGTEAHYVITEESHVQWFFEIACQIKALHVYQGCDPFRATLDISVLRRDFHIDVPEKQRELIASLAYFVGHKVLMRVGTNGDGLYFYEHIVAAGM